MSSKQKEERSAEGTSQGARRELLKGLAVGAMALPLAGVAKAATGTLGQSPAHCAPPPQPGGRVLPNVVVETHEGQKALFYNDLLRGRIVGVHFMSIAADATYPVIGNLAKTQALLGDRLGKDVFFFSISTDPENDTPERLKEFALEHGINSRGWLLLRPRPEDVPKIHASLFRPRPGAHIAEDCSPGLVRYGNVEAGLWGSFPARDVPENIVRRFSWVKTREPFNGTPKRRGPAVLPPHLRAS